MAEDLLADAGGGMNFSTVSEALMPQLEAALLEAADSTEATKKIRGTQTLMLAARASLPHVMRLAGPTSPEDVWALVFPLTLLWPYAGDFGRTADGQAAREAWLKQYQDALAPYPKEALQIAVDEWRRVGASKFPAVSDLVKIAEREAAEIRLIAYRLKKAVEADEAARPPKRTEEELKRGRELIASLRGANGRIDLSKPLPPTLLDGQ